MPRIFVSKKNIHNDKGAIGGQGLNHLRKVLRLRPGDHVTLFDGEGWEHEGIIQSYTAHTGEIKILKSCQPGRESSLHVTLAQAVGKGDKMDWLVEKATELGVGAVVPFLSDRTVPKLDRAKVEKRRARWQKIALSAAEQCGRTRIPEIFELRDFEQIVQDPWPGKLKILFWEQERFQNLSQVREEEPPPDSLLLLIGPEGGFSAEEASEATLRGFKAVSLGTRTLRTETAALAALSIVQFLWGDMG